MEYFVNPEWKSEKWEEMLLDIMQKQQFCFFPKNGKCFICSQPSSMLLFK